MSMFGMSNKKTKETDTAPLQFDLEKELKDKVKRSEYVTLIGNRVLSIKELLRQGSKKEDFDCLGTLLNGYQALAIVLGKATAVKQQK